MAVHIEDGKVSVGRGLSSGHSRRFSMTVIQVAAGASPPQLAASVVSATWRSSHGASHGASPAPSFVFFDLLVATG